MNSVAKEARKQDPYGCSLDKDRARAFWKHSNFIDSKGDCHFAKHVHYTNGILSVEFEDGSILSMPQWQS